MVRNGLMGKNHKKPDTSEPEKEQGRLDIKRLIISDVELATFIREQAKVQRRDINKQILFMLDYAAAYMEGRNET